MPRTKVLILTALRIEAAHVRKAGGSATDIDLCVIGMGAGHLPELGSDRPDCIILAGFAGGLSPQLGVGDVVIDTGGERFALPPGVCPGAIHGSPNPVLSAEEKRSLFLSNQCLAVDM